VLRPTHLLAAALGVAWVMLPLAQPWLSQRASGLALRCWHAAWPLAGFLLSFGLVAARGSVPFLYFQF